MDTSSNNLRKLLYQLRSISLWSRIFNWGQIKHQLYDAVSELERLSLGLSDCREQASRTETEIEFQQEKIKALEKEKIELTQYLKQATEDLGRYKEELIDYKKEDQFRKHEHSNAVATLTKIQTRIQEERQKETDETNRLERERLLKMKETWLNHQDSVRNAIKSICSRYTIEYINKVPFKGDPDNTVKICDEFIIFDAKSPAGEDLNNFPLYIKDQAERAKKYCKEDCVRNDIFLVVPTNTLPRLKQFVYRLADYTVYVVSLDTLEPLILSLQKLEDYEFVEHLSPEERESICRILGKFAHLAKRRIQVDTFFTKQFMELAYKCESDLPADILEKAVEFEKAEKLNPPTERRAKQINLKELDDEARKLRNETSAKGIAPIEQIISVEMDKMPLYTNEYD